MSERSHFHVTARDFLVVKTLTKTEHDEIVARKRRPFTQDPIGAYPTKGLEMAEEDAA